LFEGTKIMIEFESANSIIRSRKKHFSFV